MHIETVARTVQVRPGIIKTSHHLVECLDHLPFLYSAIIFLAAAINAAFPGIEIRLVLGEDGKQEAGNVLAGKQEQDTHPNPFASSRKSDPEPSDSEGLTGSTGCQESTISAAGVDLHFEFRTLFLAQTIA